MQNIETITNTNCSSSCLRLRSSNPASHKRRHWACKFSPYIPRYKSHPQTLPILPLILPSLTLPHLGPKHSLGRPLLHPHLRRNPHYHRPHIRHLRAPLGLRQRFLTRRARRHHLRHRAIHPRVDRRHNNHGHRGRHPVILFLRYGRTRADEISPRGQCVLLPFLHTGEWRGTGYKYEFHRVLAGRGVEGVLLRSDRDSSV